MAFDVALRALAGGVLIGAGAAALLLFNGRVAGVSGILGELLGAKVGEQAWRLAFVAGLILPALVLGIGPFQFATGWMPLLAAGLLVGFGTRLGSGCTSGHGVCGLANFSRRSLVATLVFMVTAILTVYLVRHGVPS